MFILSVSLFWLAAVCAGVAEASRGAADTKRPLTNLAFLGICCTHPGLVPAVWFCADHSEEQLIDALLFLNPCGGRVIMVYKL
jgi:hypothetical protein